MGTARTAPKVIKNPDGTTTTQPGQTFGSLIEAVGTQSGMMGSGSPSPFGAIASATKGIMGGGKASMRFAGDALDSKKEDVKSQEESKLAPTPVVKPEAYKDTSRFSGESLKKMSEQMRNTEKQSYERSLASLLDPNSVRQQVDQGLISSLPKPLQMMVRGV